MLRSRGAFARQKMMAALLALLFLLGGTLAACSSSGSGTLSGTVASVDSAASSFTLTPQPASASASSVTVRVNTGTEFRGALHGLSDLVVGMLVKVHGSAASNAFTATQVENEDQDEDQNEDRAEFKGTVNSFDSANTSFEIQLADGSTRSVITDGQTEFEGTLHAFADIMVGQRVEVKGATQADGSILAASVEGENEDEANEENEGEVEGTGKVLSVGSDSFVMQLGAHQATIIVSSATDFDGGLHSLADLKAGMLVEVRGQLQSNGAIAASRVHGEDDHSGSGSGGSGGDGHGGGDDSSSHGGDSGSGSGGGSGSGSGSGDGTSGHGGSDDAAGYH